MDVYRRLANYWRGCGLNVPPGVDLNAIRAFESKYGLTLPADLRAYFSMADGSGEEMDEDLYRFWSLAEFKPVHEELSDVNSDRFSYPGCFVFADHCISCWDYAVKITQGFTDSGPVFRVTGGPVPGEPMAATFVEFVESYLAGPSNII